MKIRIKTEQEFLKEFGENWRTSVSAEFVEEMDKFLGITVVLTEDNENRFKLYKDLYCGGWKFSPDMYYVIEGDLSKDFSKTCNKSYILI